MKKVKILYLINKKAQAGAQNHLQELMRGLNTEAFEAKLITLRELGIKRVYGISGVMGLIKLIKYMKNNQSDIVQSYLFSENILGVIAAKIAGVKWIITGRRDTGLLMQGKWQHILAYRLTNRWVDKIVCVSEAVKKVVLAKERAPIGKLEVIYNGVDVDVFRPQTTDRRQQIKTNLGMKEGEFVVGIIANFSWIKGHQDFIKAANFVLKEIPNVKFLLVGDGPLKESCQLLVSSSHLKDKVLFLGSRQDIPELLSIMDVSVSASYSEGMSNTILESMAAGVPVVATGVDGNLETVVDKESGILVPPKRPLVMADAIIMILKKPQIAKKMGETARQMAIQKFNSQVMVDNFENLYLSLTKSTGRVKTKTAFLLSQFPETHETFILREFNALRNKGMEFCIISLKRCKDRVVHPEAKDLLKQTIYGRLYSRWSIAYGFKHPLRAMAAFGYILKTYFRQPYELVKAIYVWLECFYLANIIKREGITHIHSHWATMPTTAAVILSKLTGIPYSFTAHAWDIFVNTSGLAEKIDKAKFVVTCTEYNRKYLSDLYAKRYPLNAKRFKIHLNYHGVELDKFNFDRRPSTIDYRPARILAVGRLVEQKGFEYLILACKILEKRGIDFECKIIGEGLLRQSLEHCAINCQVASKVQFLGVQSQSRIRQLLKDSDMFIAPSMVARDGDRDGIPNVILEAMAMGVPVIASEISGIPEVVVNGNTGLLVSSANSISLALAIENLWRDPGLREKLALNARKLIEEKFDAAKNGEKLIEIFRKSLEGAESRPINVMYIIWSLAMGGAERVVINLAKGLDRDEFAPIVCCLNNKGVFAQELEDQGIKVIALNKRGKFDFMILGKLVRLMKMHKIQVVHTHLWGANFWGRAAALVARVPFIIATEHNLDPWKRKYHLIIDKYLSCHTHKIIAVSNTVKDFYVGKAKINQNKITVVHNGIELEKFSFIKKRINDEVTLGVIGRLVPQKGHKYFLMALKDLMPSSNIKGLVVGSGPEEKNLKELSERIGLNGRVRFAGFNENIPELLKEIDIMVLPSLREGLPMIALEAMASGVPVVATRVGGTPELISDRETGLLVNPEDHRALKASIENLIRDKYLMEQLRNNARKKVEAEFSSNRMVTKTKELYQEIIRN